MNESLNEILNQYRGVFTDDILMRYVGGNATQAESRHIESLMADDPFLADAIEGLMLGEQEVHKRNIAFINKNVIAQERNWFRILGASSAVAACLLIGFYVFNYGIKKTNSLNELSNTNSISADTVMVGSNKMLIDSSIAINEEIVKRKIFPPHVEADENVVADNNIAWADKSSYNTSRSADDSDFITTDSEPIIVEEEIAPSPVLASKNMPLPELEQNQKELTYTTVSNDFNQLASLTKDFQENDQKLEESKTELKLRKAKAVSKKKCENCIDDKYVAFENQVADSLVNVSAKAYYEQGNYVKAAVWYNRNNDFKNKLMAGVSYLKAGNENSCILVEKDLLEIDVPASKYLKALRLSNNGDKTKALDLLKNIDASNSQLSSLVKSSIKLLEQ
jgi:hypothetical protein